MPSRNIRKEYVSDSYYHIYSRGINKQELFKENADYKYFIKLFERYLSKEPIAIKTGGFYPNFLDNIEIAAYCLMSNHFHILIYQKNARYLEKLMRSIMTSYSMYFNLKYRHTGPVFESRYKSVRIDQEKYLQHITRYIHLNPRLWQRYKYSSLKYYRDGKEPDWLNNARILDMFTYRCEYMNFVADYENMRDTLNEIKYQLVD